MHSKKGDLVLKYVISLVLILIFTLALYNFGARFLGLNRTAQGEKSFYELTKTMDEIAPNSVEPLNIRLDKHTGIVAFKKDANRSILLEDYWVAGNRLGLDTIFSFNRFNSCPQDKACICLVKDISTTFLKFLQIGDLNDFDPWVGADLRFNNVEYDSFIMETNDEKWFRKNVICKGLDNSDFLSFYYYDMISFPESRDENKNKIHGFQDGFFFINEEPFDFLKVSQLYISKNTKNEILFCFSSNCTLFDLKIDKYYEADIVAKIEAQRKANEQLQNSQVQQDANQVQVSDITQRTYADPDDRRAAFKRAICLKESNCVDSKENLDGDAHGRYQFKAATALGYANELQGSGIALGIGQDLNSLSQFEGLELMRQKLKEQQFSELIMDRHVNWLDENFDGNLGLMALGHYTDPNDVISSLKIVYPNTEDYSAVDINEFSNARAQAKIIISRNQDGTPVYADCSCQPNDWLTRPQRTGDNLYPSILDYGVSVLGNLPSFTT